MSKYSYYNIIVNGYDMKIHCKYVLHHLSKQSKKKWIEMIYVNKKLHKNVILFTCIKWLWVILIIPYCFISKVPFYLKRGHLYRMLYVWRDCKAQGIIQPYRRVHHSFKNVRCYRGPNECTRYQPYHVLI